MCCVVMSVGCCAMIGFNVWIENWIEGVHFWRVRYEEPTRFKKLARKTKIGFFTMWIFFSHIQIDFRSGFTPNGTHLNSLHLIDT